MSTPEPPSWTQESATCIPPEVVARLKRPFQATDREAETVEGVRRIAMALEADNSGLEALRAVSDAMESAMAQQRTPYELRNLPGEDSADWHSAYQLLLTLPPSWRRVTLDTARLLVQRGAHRSLKYCVRALVTSMTWEEPPQGPPDWLLRMPTEQSERWRTHTRAQVGPWAGMEQRVRGMAVPERNSGWYLSMLAADLPGLAVQAERVRGNICFHPDAYTQYVWQEQRTHEDRPRCVASVHCPRCAASMMQLVPDEAAGVVMYLAPSLISPAVAASLRLGRAAGAAQIAAQRLFDAGFVPAEIAQEYERQRGERPGRRPGETLDYRPPDPRVFETRPSEGTCAMDSFGDDLPDDLRGWVR